jgi:hypothetical protein
MKTNKLKSLLIATCCFVAALGSETKCMDALFEASFPDINGHQSGGLLKFPRNNRCMLYDVGASNASVSAAMHFSREISGFFMQQPKRNPVLDIIVSHPNEDTCGLIKGIITELERKYNNFNLGNIILGGKEIDYKCGEGINEFNEFITRLADGHKVIPLYTGDAKKRSFQIIIDEHHYKEGIHQNGNVVDILDYSHISPNKKSNYQNCLVRVNMNYNTNEFSFLLPGGMQDQTPIGSHMRRLQQLGQNEKFYFKSNGSLGSHHGGAASIDRKREWDFEIVQPEFKFYINDRNGRYNHPYVDTFSYVSGSIRYYSSPRLRSFNSVHALWSYDPNEPKEETRKIKEAIFSTRDHHNIGFILNGAPNAVDRYRLYENTKATRLLAIKKRSDQYCSKNILINPD